MSLFVAQKESAIIRECRIRYAQITQTRTCGGILRVKTDKTQNGFILIPKPLYFGIPRDMRWSENRLFGFLIGRMCDVRVVHRISEPDDHGDRAHWWDGTAIRLAGVVPSLSEYELGDGGHG